MYSFTAGWSQKGTLKEYIVKEGAQTITKTQSHIMIITRDYHRTTRYTIQNYHTLI